MPVWCDPTVGHGEMIATLFSAVRVAVVTLFRPYVLATALLMRLVTKLTNYVVPLETARMATRAMTIRTGVV